MTTLLHDAPELLARLQSGDSGIRRLALLELTDFAGDEHTPLFIAALGDTDADVRLEAARALEALECPQSAHALALALNDSDDSVRDAAAQALSELKLPASAIPLLALLPPHARDQAPQWTPAAHAALLRALRELRAPGSLEPGLLALGNADATVRREAVAVLGWLKHPSALAPLGVVAGNDPAQEVRRAAIGALGYAPGANVAAEAVHSALLAGLADVSWQVREEAAGVLGKLATPGAGDALLPLLNDPYWQVRLRAARSLGRLRHAPAVTPLADALRTPVANLRKEAALALGEIRLPQALPALATVADDPDPDVRKSVRLAIRQIELHPAVQEAA